MRAIILSIGNELTSGQTVDTNSAYISRRLAECGIEPLEHWTVGDARPAIRDALVKAAQRADVVAVSGGLGPTADDQSRQALAEAMGVELLMDPKALAEIEEFFARRHRPMVPANRIQAMAPAGAEILPNPVGTAPGLAAEVGRARIFIVPGVPSEMRRMIDGQVLPRLGQVGRAIRYHTLHTFGSGESDVGSRIQDLMEAEGDISVGTTVAAGMVSIRIISRAATPEQAASAATGTAAEVRRRLGRFVIGEGEDGTLPRVVASLLRDARQTLATAESCTGGLLGSLITDVPGASQFYLGGFVCYSNQAKTSLAGVPADLIEQYGAVSEQVAAALAEGTRTRLGADWAIAITGIAGPTGGSDAKPVGTVYAALAGPTETVVEKSLWPGSREMIRLRSALSALNMLRLKLI